MSDAKGGGDWDEKKGDRGGAGDDRGGHAKADDYQLRQDADHLKILSIIWYVIAGLQALVGVCGGGYFMMFGLIFADAAAQQGAAPMGAIGICFGIAYFVMGLTMAFLSFLVASGLSKRKRHMLCLIMGGLMCLGFPLGTILGVFTIIVLIRPTVKQAFGVA